MGACIMRFTGFLFLVMFLHVPAFSAALNTSVTGSGSIHGPGIDCPGDCSEEYDTGTVVTLHAVPDTGWEFVGWSGDATGSERPIQIIMDGDRNINALFAVTDYTITATAGSGGSISPSGEVNVSSGGSQTFSMAPDGGYQIADVLVDGTSVGAQSSYTFSNVDGDHSISVSFSPVIVSYTITATAGIGGAISPSGIVVVSSGSTRTFTISPDVGYRVANVIVDGASQGPITRYTFPVISSNHSISATFTPEIMAYTITASAGSGGTISPSGNVSVAGGGSQSFVIAPDSGYVIEDVVVDGASVGAVSIYTFNNVTAGHTITALFTQSSSGYSITATAGPGGAIDPSGTVTVLQGEDRIFTITPDAGFEIGDVLVDGTSVGNPSEYSFQNVQADHSIQVSFLSVSGPYALNITASEGGSVSTDPLGATFAPGTMVTLTAVPSRGYAFEAWSGDLTGRGNPTVIVMDSAKAINAEFLLDQDVDGEGDTEEWGPDGTNPEYDGNGDGIPDAQQANVVSLHTYDGKYYMTIEGPEGSSFAGTSVSSVPNGAPDGYSYPYGLINFRITGIQPGSAIKVKIFISLENTRTTYYKFNPDAGTWEDFYYDGKTNTGVKIDNNIITMYFVDGGRGDQDGAADGSISDPGAPAIVHNSKSWYNRCFISAAGSPGNGYDAGAVLLFLIVLVLSRKKGARMNERG